MSVFLERFVLAVFATALISLVVINVLNFDWTQRTTLGVCLVAGAYFAAYTVHKQREAIPAPSASSTAAQSDIALRTRISALIGEAVKLQEQCQSVPNAYKTPAGATPLLTKALFDWKQRVQDVLAMDLDPEPLQKWQGAILYTSPEDAKNPSIATFCTELNVKLATLREIAKQKAQK